MTLFWTESMPAAKGAAAAGRRSTIAKAVADRTRAPALFRGDGVAPLVSARHKLVRHVFAPECAGDVFSERIAAGEQAGVLQHGCAQIVVITYTIDIYQ